MAFAALFKMRDDGLHSIQSRLGVDGHHLVEIGVGQVKHLTSDSAPGVVDPYIHMTKGA